MAAPFKKQVKILLEKGCDFQIGVRKGHVLELRAEGYLVSWEAWTDPDIGECHESDFNVISYDAICIENNFGTLKIIRRPLAKPADPDKVRRSERVLVEIARMRFRKQYVLAIQEMLDKGELKPIRDDFDAKVVDIITNGRNRYDKYVTAKLMREPRRGGSIVKHTEAELKQVANFHQGFKSGHTMWKWYWQWRIDGDDGLFDNYRNCGKYDRYNNITEAFVCKGLS